MGTVTRVLLVLSLCAGSACDSFGNGQPKDEPADGGAASPDADATSPDADATSPDADATSTVPIRCATISCPGSEKCCLPLDSSVPSCR